MQILMLILMLMRTVQGKKICSLRVMLGMVIHKMNLFYLYMIPEMLGEDFL